MDSTPGLEIEEAAYNEFFGLWNQGMFEKQRLGQAFYNYFRLHRLTTKRPCLASMRLTGRKRWSRFHACFRSSSLSFLKAGIGRFC